MMGFVPQVKLSLIRGSGQIMCSRHLKTYLKLLSPMPQHVTPWTTTVWPRGFLLRAMPQRERPWDKVVPWVGPRRWAQPVPDASPSPPASRKVPRGVQRSEWLCAHFTYCHSGKKHIIVDIHTGAPSRWPSPLPTVPPFGIFPTPKSARKLFWGGSHLRGIILCLDPC